MITGDKDDTRAEWGVKGTRREAEGLKGVSLT
jgi:hypothetical protein